VRAEAFVSQQDIVNLAKEGDAKAIAFLIGQALQSFGVTAKASSENDTLHLLLEGEKLPAQDACIRVAVKGLQRLQPNHIYSLTIYGRQNGQQLPAWTQNIELKKTLNSQPASAGTSRINAILQKVEPLQNVKIAEPQIIEKSPPKPLTITTEKPNNQPQERKLVGQKTKSKKPWLSIAALSVILVPISGIVLAAQFTNPQAAWLLILQRQSLWCRKCDRPFLPPHHQLPKRRQPQKYPRQLPKKPSLHPQLSASKQLAILSLAPIFLTTNYLKKRSFYLSQSNRI